MNENETLRERMWDLCYGLLSAEEVAALHKQIKSDPSAARLYAEVRLQADLVASAAKVEDASVTLSVPDEGRKVQPAAKKHSGPSESPFQKTRSSGSGKKSFPIPSYRAANWLAGLAATALVALIGYGLYAPRWQARSPADDQFVAYVYGPATVQSGLTQIFKFVSKNSRGEPASTFLAYRVYFDDGKVALQDTVRTDESGQAQVALPGNVVQQGAVLQVQAQSDKRSASPRKESQREEDRTSVAVAETSPKLVVPLDAKAEPVTTDVRMEKDLYEPGETVRFWSHSWRAFSNQPVAPAEEWKLAMADGRELASTTTQAQPEAGIVAGEFQLPADAPTGYYQLRSQSPETGETRDFKEVAVGAAAEADRLAEGLADVRRTRQLKDGGRMQRGLSVNDGTLAPRDDKENTRDNGDALSKMKKSGAADKFAGGDAPPALRSATATPAPAPAEAPAAPKAAGSRAAVPLAAAREEAKPKRELESASGLKPGFAGGGSAESLFKKTTEGAEPRSEAELYEQIGAVQILDDELVVQVPAELAGRKLLVIATKAGTQVARQEFSAPAVGDSKAREGKSAALAELDALDAKNEAAQRAQKQEAQVHLGVPLPPEADGELDVSVYDHSGERPQFLFRESVQRESSRGLQIDVVQNAEGIAPNQAMRLKLRATDQKGREVPHAWFAAQIVKADATANLYSRFATETDAALDRSRSMLRAAPGGTAGAPANAFDESKDRDSEKKQMQKVESSKADSKSSELRGGGESTDLAKRPALDAPAGPTTAGSAAFDAPKEARKEASESEGLVELPRFSEINDQEMPAEALLVSQEVLLGSTDAQVRQAVQADEQVAQSSLIRFQQLVGRLVLVAAAATLLLFGGLAIVHRPAQAKVWIPAMVVVAGSFVVGSIWMMNGIFAKKEMAVASATPTEAQRDFSDDIAPRSPAMNAPSPQGKEHLASSWPEAQKDSAPSGGQLEKTTASTPGGVGPTLELSPGDPRSFGAQGGGFGGGGSGMANKSASAVAGKHSTMKADFDAKPAPFAEATNKPHEPAAATPAAPSKGVAFPAEKVAETAEAKEEKSKLDRQARDLNRSDPARDNRKLMKEVETRGDKAVESFRGSQTDIQREKRARSQSLLWQPHLEADEKGEAELEMNMPAEAGDYILIVDVQGPAGVGTIRKHIPVRVPPASPDKP